MKAYELAKKLFEEAELTYTCKGVVEVVLCAYSDSHRGLDEERNLNFFCPHPVKGIEALFIAEKCIVSYNEFNAKVMEQVVDRFGEDALYFFAREGSVCIYVRPVNRCIFFNEDETINLKCDEFSYDPDLQMFRIWWD